MGVTGLWRLIEPAGKPVPVETLENKVIAVDISIWLHQMVKGYQDTKGAPIPNAHLMGLFQRLCKLLYFRIKPVFVFDGGFPDLKKETIAKRQFNKSKYNSESERLKRELALLLSKKTAISSLLGREISPKKATTSEPNNDDIFKLPALPVSKDESESESEDEQNSSSSVVDLHSVDIQSDKFKSLPVKDKYDLLIELKETRKQNSWGRLHELPKKSDNFSDFQLQRLLKRRKVQECLQETEKEMGDGGMSIIELESILNEEGIDTKIESLPTRRIASNNTTRFLLINNVKQALAEAKKKKELESNPGTSKDIETPICETQAAKNGEPEDDLEAAIKMSLECVDDQDTLEAEKQTTKNDELENDLERAIKLSLGNAEDLDASNDASKTDDSWTSIMIDSDNTDCTDSEEEDGFEQSDLSSAKAYIMQYSDFTKKAINEIVSYKENSGKKKSTVCNVDKILDDINKEESVIVENIELSSDEDRIKESMKTFEKKCGNATILENEKDIDATQSSVICVDNPVQDVVLLDTSLEDSEDSNMKCNLERELSCDITNKLDTRLHKNLKDNDSKQPTFVVNEKSSSVDSDATRIKIESSSSDDEFEDVSDVESETKKPVVQLILDMDQSCDEKDDIFADVFTTKEITSDANETTTKEAEISTEITKVTQSHSNKNNIFKDIDKFAKYRETQENACEPKEESIVIKDNNDDSLLENIPNKNENSLKNQTANNELSSNVTGLEYNKDCSLNKNTLNTKAVSIENTVACNEPNELKKSRDLTQGTMSIEKLNEMAEKVASKEQELIQEKGRMDRIGRNITEQMTKEAQELLQIFGIPYIVAPMEAEAQCAFLESVNLTDGTITDDSDIWLFGGKTVYKNFFNQKKHVLQFLSDRIERSFNLTREQLVLLALLVGSDYTTGVDGVGPVTAMEILASFPYHKKQYLSETSKHGRYQKIITGLEEFKKWVRAGKRTDNTSLKKKLRNVSLTDDFPSSRVVQAYMEPNVENSKEKFTWGEMDITILRDYTKAKFGWSQSKLDEIINPVLKRIQERKSQKTVQDYFKRKVVFQNLDEQMSKRVKAAVQKMGPDNMLIDDLALIESEEPIPTKKRKTNAKFKTGAAKPVIKTNLVPGLSKISSDMSSPNTTVVSSIMHSKTSADIVIPKTARFQEIIPQREKDKQCLLQNKMKAIEMFRKTKIDRKKKFSKRKVIVPKDKAELSESSNSD